MGSDKILFTPVPMPRNGARVLPLEVVPVPGHGAQIFAQALTKSSVQTIKVPVPENRVRAPSLNGA